MPRCKAPRKTGSLTTASCIGVAAMGPGYYVGGMAPGGSFPEAREVIQEGTLISPVRAVENGEFRTDILNMILGMSRLPTNMNLDFRGMLAANHVAIKRIHEPIEQYGPEGGLSVASDVAAGHPHRCIRFEE